MLAPTKIYRQMANTAFQDLKTALLVALVIPFVPKSKWEPKLQAPAIIVFQANLVIIVPENLCKHPSKTDDSLIFTLFNSLLYIFKCLGL